MIRRMSSLSIATLEKVEQVLQLAASYYFLVFMTTCMTQPKCLACKGSLMEKELANHVKYDSSIILSHFTKA